MSSPSVASSTGPAKGNSGEEVRSFIGEAPEGEQAKGMAQDPPRDAQDLVAADEDTVRTGIEAVAEEAAVGGEEETVKEGTDDPIIIDDPINIDEEIQRFNGWLSWKLSRSRMQEADMEKMHIEEDWVMSMVECYEIFELVDAGKLLEFFKIGAAAHKRHAIRRGKRPEGAGPEEGENDDDDDDDQGNNPDVPPTQSQTQPHTQGQTQTQTNPHGEDEGEVSEKDDDPKDDVHKEPSREEDVDDVDDVDIVDEAVEEAVAALEEEPPENTCRDVIIHPAFAFDGEQLRRIFEAIFNSMEEQNKGINELYETLESKTWCDNKSSMLTRDHLLDIKNRIDSLRDHTTALQNGMKKTMMEISDLLLGKFRDQHKTIKDQFELLELKNTSNNLELKHLMESKFLEQNLKIDEQNLKIDEQNLMMDQVIKTVHEVKTSQELLTQTLLKFLDDTKKGEGSVSKEQRSEGHHHQQSFRGGSSQYEGKSKTIIQKPQSETLSMQEMREFEGLFKEGHWPKHMSKQDCLYYYLEKRKKGEKILKVAKSKKKGYRGQIPTTGECTQEFVQLFQHGSFGPKTDEVYE
ncbi:hypothetical protein Dimus_038032 [Dionaea muscipula]